MKNIFSITRKFCLFASLAAAPVLTVSAHEGHRPNVVIVMADDLGIGDVSPTNPDCQIKTPNLQRLADEGMTFLDAHTTSSVCTPTRYGLLTGRYNWRSRLARGVLNGRSDHLIPAERSTIAHLLKNAGYHTAMIGKWHLGWDWHKTDGKIDFTQPVLNGPNINGFDQYYGHCGSLDMPPYVWVDTGQITAPPDREEGVNKRQHPYGWYRKGPIGADFQIDQVLPHLFDKSIEYIKQRLQPENSRTPFFLYLPLPAPHTPIVPISPFRGISGINPYADFVVQVDYHVGQLLDAIEEAGLKRNTLFVFTSDNGCSPEGNFTLLREHGHDPSAGYRGHKADIYEGGHRVPFIVRWPARVKSGQTTQALTCLTDIYATLEAIVNKKLAFPGGEDGYSLFPVLDGAPSTGRKLLVSHSVSGHFAVRQENWKLCLASGSGGWSAPRENVARQQGLPKIQLFDLDQDRAEQNNVAEDNPEKVKALLQSLQELVDRGRSTPGPRLANDRQIEFLPQGVTLP